MEHTNGNYLLQGIKSPIGWVSSEAKNGQCKLLCDISALNILRISSAFHQEEVPFPLVQIQKLGQSLNNAL